MGSKEADESRAPKLPLFSVAPTKSPEQYSLMGVLTPPHHTASVPFNWEEEPGKPRPTKAQYSSNKGLELELPPRLLKPTKTPTLLDSRSIFHSFGFVMCSDVSLDAGQTSLVLSKGCLLQAQDKPPWRKTGFASTHANKEALAKPSFTFWESIYEAVKQVIPGTRRSTNGKWEH